MTTASRVILRSLSANRSGRRPLALVAALMTATLALAACQGGGGGEAAGTPKPAPAVLDAKRLTTEVAALPQKSVKAVEASRLADGLVPPTNRWFSSLALGPAPLAVFPLPLSFSETATGFGFGVPNVKSSEKGIMGGYVGHVPVTVPGLKSTVVSGYDDLTVTLEQRADGGAALGHTTLSQGSPFVTFSAADAIELTQPVVFAGSTPVAKVDGRTYGLVLSKAKLDGTRISVEKGGSVTWFAVPDGGSADVMARSVTPVTGGELAYSVGSSTASTSLTYLTPGDALTVFAAMPHQKSGLDPSATCDLGTFPSVYGTMSVCRGRTLTWTAPTHPVVTSLDLSKITPDEKQTLTAQVRADVADAKPFPADTYFGGKALFRVTQILEVAEQLGLTTEAASLRKTLTTELEKWTEPSGCTTREAFCFVYDPKTKGIVGMTPSFGSDEFNDHHFHSGYFLYTAGVLAAKDPALAKRLQPVMDLVAADIASSGAKGTFPDRRVFDAYASHSWASGTSPFGDGNNQESTSEAVTAWTGLTLWARATANKPLEAQATWMLSGEEATALAYGLNIDRSDPVYAGFGHQVISLNWGGKRDYATWFSPAPAALLAILVLPASPSSAAYLGTDPARVKANVAEATASGGYAQKFGDYLLMYAALAGEPDRVAALAQAQQLDPQWIDDGNSRTYLLAWLMAVRGAA